MGALLQTGRAFSARQVSAIPKRRWAPDQSQVALDFRHGDYFGSIPTFVRATAATAFDERGVLKRFDSGKLRHVPGVGVLVEVGRTNRLALKTANPTDVTGWLKTGNASSTLTVQDSIAALEAAGLFEVCDSGKVFQLQNTAGSGLAAARGTVVASTAAHASFAFVRGNGQVRVGVSGATGSFQNLTSDFRPVIWVSPSPAGTAVFILEISFGATLQFILPQLELGNTVTSSIVNDGAANTRNGEQLGADLSGFADLANGFGGAFEYDIRQAAATGGSPVVFAMEGSTGNRVQFVLSGTDLVGQVYAGGTLIKSQKVSSWPALVGAMAFSVSSNHLWARRIGQADEGVATGFTLPSVTKLALLGNAGSANNNCHGYAKRIALAFGTQTEANRNYWLNVGTSWLA